MHINEIASEMLTKGVGFIRRQPRDWKITVGRSSLARFVYHMVLPYQSVYTMSLGATATQLGIVNSAGMGIAGLMSTFAGWVIGSFNEFAFAFVADPKSDRLGYGIAAGELNRKG